MVYTEYCVSAWIPNLDDPTCGTWVREYLAAENEPAAVYLFCFRHPTADYEKVNVRKS